MDIKYGEFSFADSGIPIPRVSYRTEYDTTSAGRNIGANLNISLNGFIYMSGDVPGDIKLSGLKKAFSYDFQSFEIECGSTELFPDDTDLEDDINKGIRVNNINFSNSTDEYWRQIIDFNIEMVVPLNKYENFIDKDDIYISSLNDSWTINTNDMADYLEDSNSAYYPSGGPLSSRYYNITHTVSSEGKTQNDRTAFQNAKSGVHMILDKGIKFFGGVKNSDGGLKIYDRAVSYDADTINGRFTFTENFKAFSGNPSKAYTHNFTINNSLDDKFNRTVTVNGTIQGFHLETQSERTLEKDQLSSSDFTKLREYASLAYYNASGAMNTLANTNKLYNLVNNAVNFPSGDYISKYDNTQSDYNDFKLDLSSSNHSPKTERLSWINPIPVSFTTDHDQNNGTVSYSCSFNNRPLNLITDAITETLSVNDKHPTTGYASQNVMRRGAIMQSIGTTTTPSRTVTYTANFKSRVNGDEFSNNTILTSYNTNQIDNMFKQFDPGETHTNFFSWITDDAVNYDPIQGSFSKTKTWNYALNRQ